MLLDFLFIMGLGVEAITGALAAGRKKMDFFGVVLIASVTSLGGGAVRDILFNTYPLTWVVHPGYLLYTSICALITIFIAPSVLKVLKLFLILDALGLATFVVVGTQKMLSLGLAPSSAIIGGMITGICGGMLRDILCNEIPLVLRKELYAIIALSGALLYIILEHISPQNNLNIIITLIAIFMARLLAILFHIEMPKFDYQKILKNRRSK